MQRRTADLRTRLDRPRRDGFDLWFLFVGLFVATAFAIGIASLVTQASDPSWSHVGGIAVWTDPATGCRYTQSEAGMQPLVGPDGRPDCQRRAP
ncbi:hypothetical protein MKK68_19505 [Methylobacterium sp. E-016]|jgi:hypothetical protein|uniref:hypothetical protein n=1 Tax=Methylobacterium sp. E-016 TaxID=2836556 RepID=UPI001FB971C1|nr:hypothetical protein [Methylobacterium sp. E-016]MCJ2077803.1 hypothetical protein [Methylobacterium sp. E-016]